MTSMMFKIYFTHYFQFILTILDLRNGHQVMQEKVVEWIFYFYHLGNNYLIPSPQ